MLEEKEKYSTDNLNVTRVNGKSVYDNAFCADSNKNNEEYFTGKSSHPGVVLSNATAKWTECQADNTLENINLTATPGRLIAIIGPVGAGKVLLMFVLLRKARIFHKYDFRLQSSLIQAILLELPLCEGSVSVRGTVSYASQEPWLFSGSVQQNILFGSIMDEERYSKVTGKM